MLRIIIVKISCDVCKNIKNKEIFFYYFRWYRFVYIVRYIYLFKKIIDFIDIYLYL